jgi:hypothetical protein
VILLMVCAAMAHADEAMIRIADLADVGFICAAFACHQVPDPIGDCP